MPLCFGDAAKVYHQDAQAREQAMSPEQRLHFHQEQSAPLMKTLQESMEAQLAEHKTEPNSGLGKAISGTMSRLSSKSGRQLSRF
jgi:transposase